ncbi:hypothetical protein ACFFUB_08475 [Algimonas porphyrae]|uniref:hypothetical protein n=1 Tax=Algimonas porphyrae TaxID=1128113 RepID=UPI0024E0E944|nr:hypothetical protein [Algimonas porphyrae]
MIRLFRMTGLARLPGGPYVPFMKAFVTALLTALSVSVLSACGSGSDNPDRSVRDADSGGSLTDAAVADMSIPDMADQVIADGKFLAELLEGVTDSDSADKIEPQVKAIVENYQRMFDKVENAGNLGFADMAALASRAPEIAQTQEAIVDQLTRIYRDHPEAADVLRESLRDFG